MQRSTNHWDASHRGWIYIIALPQWLREQRRKTGEKKLQEPECQEVCC